MTTVCRGLPACRVERTHHASLPFRSQPSYKLSKPGRLVVSASTQRDSNVDKTAATPAQSSKDSNTSINNLPEEGSNPRRQKRKAGSSDWIASAVTRRFGLGGGLIWVGVLTFGVLSEQIKTRIEQADEAKSTQVVSGGQEVVLPSGVKYKDVKIGGGSKPQKGYLMIVDFRATADGDVFEDTRERGKPIVFIYGGRPFTGGLCKGVEEAMATMKAGGRRTVYVPPSLGFGENGGSVAPTLHAPGKQGVIPRDALLTYDLELIRVSIPPS
ncbi:hypothetical protein WJX82_010927 [Trebouxia sp. C0006]